MPGGFYGLPQTLASLHHGQYLGKRIGHNRIVVPARHLSASCPPKLVKARCRVVVQRTKPGRWKLVKARCWECFARFFLRKMYRTIHSPIGTYLTEKLHKKHLKNNVTPQIPGELQNNLEKISFISRHTALVMGRVTAT